MNDKKYIAQLIQKRNQYRRKKLFDEADQIRSLLKEKGVLLEDTTQGTLLKQLEKKKHVTKKNAFLLLFGSGEISSVGRSIHEFIFKQIGHNINVAIISTPAGFQPNVKVVHEEIAEFFRNKLRNYVSNVHIIYANTHKDADNPQLIKFIDEADYIFLGPGSPSYAVTILKDTLLFKKLLRLAQKKKVTIGLSSAGVVAFSSLCLPVYEIYKVGNPLHWLPGLNFFSTLYKELTVIPHYNNKEGGPKLDTSFCYIGEVRFNTMLKLIKNKHIVWGIDENTCIIVDLKNKSLTIKGKGNKHSIDY
ncbi:Type 1 glutamine amidotransferase-like domain-containing protein [Candidatus Gottesmanbacteria bacterium]|nr:Type 1 glutamine amidotransferase-like domain-containing protein [Candidatus Gottesmanbacteria bacterium]